MNLDETLQRIKPADQTAMEECRRRWDSIAKPLGSLGKLECGVEKIAGITGNPSIELKKRALVIMCADNGVVEEGVTQAGSEITAIVAENFLEGKSCACIMAKQAGAEVFPLDIGIARDTRLPADKKVAYGTRNMRYEPAMTRDEAVKAIETGIQMVTELKKQGYSIIATGEMGIGNTTTSSAVASVLLHLPVEEVTGRGAGLSGDGLKRKIDVIQRAIDTNRPDSTDPLDVLAKVGGFDIAGMTGLFLGGADEGIPIIMDGFISAVAALVAVRMAPEAVDYILPSHVSREKAAAGILKELGMEPYLTCDMCLGEGSGAVALLSLLDMGIAVYERMSTFEQVSIEAYQPLA